MHRSIKPDSSVMFLILTTAFDIRILMTQALLVSTIVVPFLISNQIYMGWYYFKRFKPTRKELAVYSHDIVVSYSSLFVVAMISAFLVVLIGCYLIF